MSILAKSQGRGCKREERSSVGQNKEEVNIVA